MSTDFVRAALPADAAAMVQAAVAAWPALGDDVDSAALVEQWRQLLQDPGPTRALVATSAEEVVGWVLVTPASDPDLAGIAAWEVADVVVHPSARRRGHGSRLMHAAADVAPTGASVLTTWCPVADEPRRAFFAAHGLGPDGAWRDLAADTGETMREVRLIAALGESADAGDDPGRSDVTPTGTASTSAASPDGRTEAETTKPQ